MAQTPTLFMHQITIRWFNSVIYNLSMTLTITMQTNTNHTEDVIIHF